MLLIAIEVYLTINKRVSLPTSGPPGDYLPFLEDFYYIYIYISTYLPPDVGIYL